MTPVPLASVIVLNWNGKHLLRECLDSLKAQTLGELEIILVDNGSTDGSAELVRETYGESVRLVENSENLGFSGGNNVGIRASRGEFVLLLNNDAIADERWVEELVGVARENPAVGMCASKVLCHDQPDVIDNVGHLLYPDGLNRGRGRNEPDRGQYDGPEEALFPSGCAALYRRSMLDEIGLFDERHFAYGDDADLGLRGRLAGWQCLYVPTAKVYHKYSASTAPYSPLKAFLVERNRVWVLLKHFPLRHVLLSPLYTLNRFAANLLSIVRGRGAAGRFVQGSSPLKLLWILVRAYWSAMMGLPYALRRRWELRKLKRVSVREFSGWLRRFRITAGEIALTD